VNAAAARRRLRQRLLVIFLVVMLVPYARQLASSPTVGQDFRAFFAAATVEAHHGNPYDWTTLGRTEDRLYNEPASVHPGDATYYDFLPFPEGPWLAFALEPLTVLPWPVAYAIVAAVLALILLIAAFAVFDLLGWPARRARLAAACTLLAAIGFINVFMGQASVLVFGASVGAWFLARRGHPWWAGIVLALVWLKPNIGLPLPVVVLLLEPAAWRRTAAAFIAATAGLFAIALVSMGAVFFEWPVQALRMWQSVQGVQPDIASVESFFYPGLTGAPKTGALVVTLLAAIAYGIWTFRRTSDGLTRGLTLLLIWLFALPFVQSYDLILVLPLVAVLLGSRLEGWNQPLVEITLWAFVTVPILYFLGLRLGYFNGFSAIPMALLFFAWHRHRVATRPRARLEQAAA
jgi:hypothetical protein